MKICPKGEECYNNNVTCGHKEPHKVNPGCGNNCRRFSKDVHCCIEYEVKPMKICSRAETCNYGKESLCRHEKPHEEDANCNGVCTVDETASHCIDYIEEPLVVCPEAENCDCPHNKPHKSKESCTTSFCSNKQKHIAPCVDYVEDLTTVEQVSPNNLVENEPRVLPSEEVMLERVNHLMRNGFSQETAAAIAIKYRVKLPDQKPNSITSDQQLVKDCVKERLRSIDIE